MMKVTLNRVNQDYLFEVTNDNGHKVLLDNKSKEEGKVEGDIHPEKARRAVSLSFDKYCSVAKILVHSTSIKYSIFINGTELLENFSQSNS